MHWLYRQINHRRWLMGPWACLPHVGPQPTLTTQRSRSCAAQLIAATGRNGGGRQVRSGLTLVENGTQREREGAGGGREEGGCETYREPQIAESVFVAAVDRRLWCQISKLPNHAAVHLLSSAFEVPAAASHEQRVPAEQRTRACRRLQPGGAPQHNTAKAHNSAKHLMRREERTLGRAT